ncbi:ribonuclease R [Fulvivirgaceae bacterium BMA12]|uniref:Ribonuclease R n=1 Tax=Agaribacillus aureus TaxID=3051825 RepID=A0ABT8L667_9BACT|nr:ribonuclease R [Fulvivirgaceae bacterium BMA12]
MTKRKIKTKKLGKGVNENILKDQILDLLNSNVSTTYSVRQLAKILQIRGKKHKDKMLELLLKMEEQNEIRAIRNKFKSNHKPLSFIGTVDYVNPRTAFILSDGFTQDPRVKIDDLQYALDGDTVEFVLLSKPGRNPRARVERIVARKRNTFVGRIEISTRYAFVIADNKRMHYDIFVKNGAVNGARHNDKVIVEITEWPGWEKNPEGKIIKVLGKAGENNAEIHSIMAEFGLPFGFSDQVESAAQKISEKISATEIRKRKDFRKIPTFTIDPADAKDFDDALSFKKLKGGHYEVGIHIADVTHYVKQEDMLDREAFERATSVYLVDRTIPMLPERLSNGLCSLRPNEDKLTFSAIFELNENAQIIKEWFGRTIIHSDRRFTYEEAQEVIETGKGDFNEEVNSLNELAGKLRNDRFGKGAINFETAEVKFDLDEQGRPVGIIPKVRKDAHKMIEEFMLLANKRVANFIYHLDKDRDKYPFVYRTHDNPDPEKLTTFSVFARKFGHQLQLKETGVSNSLNLLMGEIEGKPEQNVLQTLAIRTMAKAKYTTEAKGHFGLAFDHYAHFTSPIRRYPDVMVHRLLQHYLLKGKPADREEYERKCEHSSEMEKRAADAERASIKYKQVEFMQNAEHKTYDGIVSGVTEWGVYVEIVETKCEGMVKIADIEDDFYEYDERNFCIVGVRNKKTITLGDNVKVIVKNTDIDRRTIDLLFV